MTTETDSADEGHAGLRRGLADVRLETQALRDDVRVMGADVTQLRADHARAMRMIEERLRAIDTKLDALDEGVKAAAAPPDPLGWSTQTFERMVTGFEQRLSELRERARRPGEPGGLYGDASSLTGEALDRFLAFLDAMRRR